MFSNRRQRPRLFFFLLRLKWSIVGLQFNANFFFTSANVWQCFGSDIKMCTGICLGDVSLITVREQRDTIQLVMYVWLRQPTSFLFKMFLFLLSSTLYWYAIKGGGSGGETEGGGWGERERMNEWMNFTRVVEQTQGLFTSSPRPWGTNSTDTTHTHTELELDNFILQGL